MTDRKTYDLGGVTYYQKEMSCGQGACFLERFDGVSFGGSQLATIATLTRRIPALAAIVLIPDNMDLEQFEKKLDTPGFIEKQEAKLRPLIGIARGVMIARDFLQFNDIFLLVENLATILAEFQEKQPGSSSQKSVPLSAAVTSPNATPSAV